MNFFDIDFSTLSPAQRLQLGAVANGMNLDANETALLERQLRHMEAQLYEVEYPELRHTRYIPQDTSTPVGAESILYRVMDQVRAAALITDYANDLPNVDVILKEYPIPIKGYGNHYKYSLRDLQHAAFSGQPIDTLRAQTARDSIEQSLDEVACLGEPSVGIKGFINNDAVDILTAATVGGDVTWADKINGTGGAAAVIADISEMRNHMIVDTEQLYRPNAYLLPTALFELINTTPFSASGGSDRTILEWFRQNNPGVSIEGWWRLDNANAAGTGGRIVAYFRDPRILVEKAVMPFNQLPPQAKSLAFIINCWALTGGTHIYRPKGVVFMDGAN